MECKNGQGDPPSISSNNHWGIFLLKVGGIMVYSTCSLNPVKNEVAIAKILWRFGEPVNWLMPPISSLNLFAIQV